MRYVSVDEIDSFDVHDCPVESIALEGGAAALALDHVNVSVDNSLNDRPTDMCTGPARVTIEGFRVEQIAMWAMQGYSADGALIRDEPARTLAPEEYGDLLRGMRNDMARGILYLYSLESRASADERLWANVEFMGFDITFSYTRLVVEWDEFTDKAWYVDFTGPNHTHSFDEQ